MVSSYSWTGRKGKEKKPGVIRIYTHLWEDFSGGLREFKYWRILRFFHFTLAWQRFLLLIWKNSTWRIEISSVTEK